MNGINIKTALPKMGGGAIVSLLDKDGKEVYNSGFVQNDLTNAGINQVLGAYEASRYPAQNSRNILFQGETGTYSNNITKVIEVRDGNGTKLGTSPTLGQGGRGYSRLGGSNNPLETEDGKIYISTKFTTNFVYGSINGNVKDIEFVGRGMVFSRIILDEEIAVTEEQQLRIEYYRIAELSDFLYLDGLFLRKKELPPHEVGDGVKVYYNPLFVRGTTSTPSSQYINYVGCANDSSDLRGDYLNFYLEGEKVGGSPRILDFVSNSSRIFNTGDLSYTLKYDFTIPPSINVPEFDMVVFSEVSSNNIHQQPSYSDNMTPKRALTVEFPEPVIKTRNDKLIFNLSVTVQGGKDSLDLGDVIPILTD